MSSQQKQAYERDQIIFKLVLQKKRSDKNKIYSLHEPSVSCISKGKEAKKYEFGNKSSLVVTKHSRIIVGAMAFEGNPYDGHTLDTELNQIERLTGKLPRVAIVDKEGITADLEAMAEAGIGGTQIFNVEEGIPHGGVMFNSPEWIEMVRFASEEAARLGLEICLHNCGGWSSSGGPWTPPKTA